MPHTQWPDLIQWLVNNIRNSAPVCAFLSLTTNYSYYKKCNPAPNNSLHSR